MSKEGNVSYTMALETVQNSFSPNPSISYFDNLVIYQIKGGKNLVHIIRYIPTEQWNNSAKDFKEFTGTMIFYRPTGEKINAITLTSEAIKESESTSKSNRKAGCVLVLVEKKTVCTALSDPNSSEPGEEKCTTTYTYELNCTMGTGGDGDYTNDPGPNEPDGLPPGGGTTAPNYPTV